MEIKVEILIGSHTSILGALGIRTAKVTITSKQGRKQSRLPLENSQQIFYFRTITEAGERLDIVLATEPRTKVKVLRRLRKAGLFWDTESIRSYCQLLAVIEDATYSFTRCTCIYAKLVPHGWVTKEGRLIDGPLDMILHRQVTTFEDLLFRVCDQGVRSNQIPLNAALWTVHRAIGESIALDSNDLRKLLRQPAVKAIRQEYPGLPSNTYGICRTPLS